ncbi:MAG: thioredoxin family protein [Bacteroidales bacterium]|nr:thioredoxin family protein [Bacteroidales bacterium]
MKTTILLSLFFLSNYVFSQEINKNINDEKSGTQILIGDCDENGLKSDVFKGFYESGYVDYTPLADVIKKLSKQKNGVEITVVMGSWCDDSQVQVPRFYKILDEMGFKKSNVNLICVDTNKNAGDTDISGLDIQRVPTFIFYKKEREIGRIVESPNSSLEKDMLLIFTMGL